MKEEKKKKKLKCNVLTHGKTRFQVIRGVSTPVVCYYLLLTVQLIIYIHLSRENLGAKSCYVCLFFFFFLMLI